MGGGVFFILFFFGGVGGGGGGVIFLYYGSKGPGLRLCQKVSLFSTLDRVYKTHYLLTKKAGPKVPISRGKQKLQIGTLCPRSPWGARSVPSSILFLKNNYNEQKQNLVFVEAE